MAKILANCLQQKGKHYANYTDGNIMFEEILDQKTRVPIPSRENFILNLVLPSFMAQSVIDDANEIFKEEILFTSLDRNFSDETQMIAGSTTDGLALPDIVHNNRTHWYRELQDEDILYIIPYLIVDTDHRRAFARPVSNVNRPGYIHLKFNSGWLERRSVHPYKIFEKYDAFLRKPDEYIDNEGLILRKKLVGILRKHMKPDIHSNEKEVNFVRIKDGKTATVEFTYNGPAVTAEIFEHTERLKRSKDYVISLPHPKWPDEAIPWQHRQRVWPSKKTIKSVLKKGCHIVPKGHKTSSDPHEFILSFVLASRAIARELNVHQVRCYLLFKYLFKFHINRIKRGLSTFHCKQTMFWLCEKYPQDRWREENPFECLQWLLQTLENFIENYNIPNYFVERNNTINHISKVTIDKIRRDIANTRHNCVSVILELTETKRFSWLSRDVGLLSLLNYGSSDELLSKNLMAKTIIEYVSKLLDKGEIFHVLGLLGIDSNRLVHLESIIERLHKMLEFSLNDDDDTICLKGFLATVYHHKANEILDLKGEEKEYDVCLTKSKDIFEETLDYVGSHIWIFGEYYNLLSQTGQHHKLVDHFSQSVLPNRKSQPSVLYEGGIYTAINCHNRRNTDYCVKETMEDFEIPSTAYLFFKAIQSFLGLFSDNYQNNIYFDCALKLLKKFETWANYKFSTYPESIDEHVQVLLGYCYSGVGCQKRSEKYFKTAEGYGLTYKNERDDLIEFEPLITKLRQTAKEHNRRLYMPYKLPFHSRRRSKRAKTLRNEKCLLRLSEVRIKPFLHY